jgi:hypothetical protein
MPTVKFPTLVPKAFDSPALSPPTVVNERDVKPVVVFPHGARRTKLLLTEENAGCRHANMGLFMADPNQGSQWHILLDRSLPARTIIHDVQNDDGRGNMDSVDVRPPQLIRPADIAITPFTAGGLTKRNMLTPDTVGARHGRFGTALETPGTGSFWHTIQRRSGRKTSSTPSGNGHDGLLARGQGALPRVSRGGRHSLPPPDQLHEESHRR